MRAKNPESIGHSGVRILLPLTASLLVGACHGAPKSSIPNYEPPPISIVETNPNAEPQCGCQNSTGAYAQNSSTSSRQISFSIYTKDTFSGQILAPIRGTATVPAAGPSGPGKSYLGCTIHAPNTQCRFQARYSLDNYASLLQLKAPESITYGAVSTPSIAACTAWCSDPSNPNSGACLPLGVRYYQAVAPVTDAIKMAQSSGGTVKQADLLKLYGLKPADDKCHRGDITTANGRIVNEGTTEACMFRSEDLPTAVLRKLGLSGVAPPTLGLVTSLQRRIEALPSGDIKALNAKDVVVFDQSESAPIFTFDGPGGAKLTKSFGGHILGTARISNPNGTRQTVVATANGCVAIDEP